MKKFIIFTILVVSGFLFSSAVNAQDPDPEKPVKTEKKSEHSADFSELCAPDWSGYEEISPDISTRALLYPKVISNKKQEKINENGSKPAHAQQVTSPPKPSKK